MVPSAIDSIISSALQNGNLSPQGAKLIAGMKQAQEFGGITQKYGGQARKAQTLSVVPSMSNQPSTLNDPASQ